MVTFDWVPRRGTGRRTCAALLGLGCLAATAPGVAHADDASQADGSESGVSPVTTTEQIGDRDVEVSRHIDPLSEFTLGDALNAPVSAGDALDGLGLSSQGAQPRSYTEGCAVSNQSGDDTAHAYFPSSSAVIKVIYAYPTDVGNRIGAYWPVIQTGMSWVSELTAGESGNTKALRLDLGTSGGPGCIDVQTIPLALPSSSYTAVPSLTFNLIKSELQAKTVGQLGTRNFIVYADGISLPNAGGEAQVVNDDSAAGTTYRLGGLWGMLYGRGGTDFFGSQTSYPAGTTSRSHVDIALHEISHTLGAVQRSAPHHSTNWHCLDEWDILCYDDDGSGGLSTYVACSTPASQIWDCNRDDYFSPSPAPGSYLATHWNLYNSPFMCAAASCAPGGVTGPPNFIDTQDGSGPPTHMKLIGPRKKIRDRTPTFRFSSDNPRAQYSCAMDGRREAPCASPYTSGKVRLGRRHRFTVRAREGSAFIDGASAESSFKVIKKTKGKRKGRSRRGH
jgi:hypothetical protein